jgi:hypothetical protein
MRAPATRKATFCGSPDSSGERVAIAPRWQGQNQFRPAVAFEELQESPAGVCKHVGLTTLFA